MGSPSAPSNPYTNGPAANNIDFGSINSNYGLANQGNQFTQNILNNPYAGGYQAAAGQAAGQYGALGGLAGQASGALYGAGNQALGAGSQILQAGFDPQKQLYAQVQNQNSQQNLAQLANMGVAATPYGAGVAGQENTNFNLDWQNNQLQREATAASAYGGLNQTAQSDFAAGGQQGLLGANSTLMAGQLPYATSNQINQDKLGALAGQQSLYSNPQQASAGYLSGYSGVQQQDYQDQLQQNQAMWSGIGQFAGMALGAGMGGFGGSSGLFGGLSGGGTSSGWLDQFMPGPSAGLGF